MDGSGQVSGQNKTSGASQRHTPLVLINTTLYFQVMASICQILHFSGITPSVLCRCDTVGILECPYKVGIVVKAAFVGYFSETHL